MAYKNGCLPITLNVNLRLITDRSILGNGLILYGRTIYSFYSSRYPTGLHNRSMIKRIPIRYPARILNELCHISYYLYIKKERSNKKGENATSK